MQTVEKTNRKNPIENKYQCTLCPFSSHFLSTYKRHKMAHLNEKPFKCPECPYKGKRKDCIKQHFKNVHFTSTQSRPFPCSHPGCSYAAKHRAHLNRHSKIHFDEKSLFCSHRSCNFSTNYKQSLTSHARTHTGEKPYKCQFESCSYASTTSGDVFVHSRTHTKEKPFKCPQPNCEYSTTQSSHLKTHTLTHPPKEGEERPSFQCPIELCEYSTARKGDLSGHMKSHSLEKPFACSFKSCEYRCKRTDHLDRHLKTHSDERRYKCELCPHRGKTRQDVRKHLKQVHSDWRPFKCTEPQCDYAAKTNGNLNIHLRIHTGEKNYFCSFPGCDYRAMRKSHISAHEYNIHSDEKREKCRICEYKFKTKTILTIHMRTHTKEEPFAYKEEGCQYRAKSSGPFKQHQKRHHPHIFNT